jgi:hypothetical protein
MSFERGAIKFRVFLAAGRVAAGAAESLYGRALPEVRGANPHPLPASGFVGGRHALEVPADAAGFRRGDLLWGHWCTVTKKVPAALLKSEIRRAELARMQDEQLLKLSARLRREIRANVEEALSQQALPSPAAIEFLVMPAPRAIVLAAASSEAQVEVVLQVLKDYVGHNLKPWAPTLPRDATVTPAVFHDGPAGELFGELHGEEFLTWLWLGAYSIHTGGVNYGAEQPAAIAVEGPLMLVSDDGATMRMAKASADKMLEDGRMSNDEGLTKWGHRSQSKGTLNATVELAKTEPGIPVEQAELEGLERPVRSEVRAVVLPVGLREVDDPPVPAALADAGYPQAARVVLSPPQSPVITVKVLVPGLGSSPAVWDGVKTSLAKDYRLHLVHVAGFASNGAGASAHGGLLVIEGDAGLRCGISLKGGDIVVGGSVGSFSAFMAQAGRMVICGNAGQALGDSLYEAVLYVRGTIASLGADAQIEPMTESDLQVVGDLLRQAGLQHDPQTFKRVASARTLYHWNADADQEY